MAFGKQDMRICSPELGISPESSLGGEVHDREILKALANLGVKIDIILPLGKKYFPNKNFNVYFLPTPFVWPPYLFNFLILPYLFRIFRKNKFDVLRVHSPYFVGFGALIFKFFYPKVKLVATYHHLDKKMNFFDKYLLNRFDLVTTVSEETRKELGMGIVIPNGVDKKYQPKPKNINLVNKYGLKDKKVLLYLGQLIKRKNIPFLFKVIKLLPKNYVLMICGEGKLRETAPEGVVFTGKVPEEMKVDYYNLADVFVYPSLKEGFGLSVAEAMACGKPVIASNVPIVENTPLDAKLWAKKIVTIKYEITKLNFSWEKSAQLLLEKLEEPDVTHTPNACGFY